MRGFTATYRLERLLKNVDNEEDFIHEVLRFYRWYITPELRSWTKLHLRRFYQERKGGQENEKL